MLRWLGSWVSAGSWVMGWSSSPTQRCTTANERTRGRLAPRTQHTDPPYSTHTQTYTHTHTHTPAHTLASLYHMVSGAKWMDETVICSHRAMAYCVNLKDLKWSFFLAKLQEEALFLSHLPAVSASLKDSFGLICPGSEPKQKQFILKCTFSTNKIHLTSIVLVWWWQKLWKKDYSNPGQMQLKVSARLRTASNKWGIDNCSFQWADPEKKKKKKTEATRTSNRKTFHWHLLCCKC